MTMEDVVKITQMLVDLRVAYESRVLVVVPWPSGVGRATLA
jgi:hypothetical protein